MLLLTSTSDIVRVVTGAAANVTANASYVDNNAGLISPGRPTNAVITTAATTTIVPAPGSGVQRNVLTMILSNTHATASTQVTVQHFDGTTSADLASVTLLPGEKLALMSAGRWVHRDSQGAEYTYNGPALVNLGITGTIAETMPRETCPEVNTTVAASGTLFLQAIYLKAGQVLNNITLCSATTAAGTPTNYLAGLFDAARNLVATTANQTTAAWAANTLKTIALTAAYRVPTSGLYYVGYFMTATTVATLKGGTAKTGGQLAGTAPILHGTSSTGLTTALPNPAAAITVGTATIYAAVA